MASQKRGISSGTVNAARTGTDMKSSKTVAIAALGIALVCIATRVFQFPIPLGYAHLGNCMILIFSVFFGPVIGAIAGGFGSALADLLSYPVWALATLIIKSIMGAIPALIAGKEGLRGNFKSPRVFFGAAAAIVEMIVGYFIGGSILYGSVATGATQIPGLAMEGVIGIVLFYALGSVIKRTGILRQLR